MLDIKKVKKIMLKSEKSLSKYACKSKEAIREYPDDEDIRLEFARDVDRIIHSSCYTRYMSKTQVFTNPINDHISTRMTHVQYVSKAARTIARALSLNEDLCEAIALGHDVGHTPYGHFGESVLNKISKAYNDGKCFAHNLNSVRVFRVLDKKGISTNLTLQVLDGIMCHNGELLQDKYMPNMKKTFEDLDREYNECLKDESAIKRLTPMTLEGCIVRISDIIGYIGKDIDDASRLGIFDRNLLPENVKKYLGTDNAQIMNSIILDVIENSLGKNYISMSENVFKAVKELKEYNYKNIYENAITQEDRKKYTKNIESLYSIYCRALDMEDKTNDIYKIFLNDMSKDYIENTSDSQKVIDYIAGMTDNFLEEQYEKYK